MSDYPWLYFLPVVFLAYFCKAISGFGSSIIIIALGSLILGPLQALILTAVLDVVGGMILLRIDPTKDERRLWLPLSVAMFLGVVIGGLLLKLFAFQRLHHIISATLIAVGIWLLFFRYRKHDAPAAKPLPKTYRVKDLVVCLIAGTGGGLTGISAPPLLYHFGRVFNKEGVRRILTRVFLVEAVARVGTYSVLGVIDPQILMVALVSVPLMFVGLYAGNSVFLRIPEVWFGRIAGVVIIIAAVRLSFLS